VCPHRRFLHLADPVAYRRDRRKDRVLEENGYFVLRFLAEDLAKDLDAVLDTILRALVSRHKSTGQYSLKVVRGHER
jgi:very-short-patch-repair endonuclease